MLTTLNISGRVRVFSIATWLRATGFRVRIPVETKIHYPSRPVPRPRNLLQWVSGLLTER